MLTIQLKYSMNTYREWSVFWLGAIDLRPLRCVHWTCAQYCWPTTWLGVSKRIYGLLTLCLISVDIVLTILRLCECLARGGGFIWPINNNINLCMGNYYQCLVGTFHIPSNWISTLGFTQCRGFQRYMSWLICWKPTKVQESKSYHHPQHHFIYFHWC